MASEFRLSPLKHFQIKQPEIKCDFAEDNYVANFTTALLAKVVDYQDKVLCDAMVRYAVENGYTDLYLIDGDFLRSAIIHELIRREVPVKDKGE